MTPEMWRKLKDYIASRQAYLTNVTEALVRADELKHVLDMMSAFESEAPKEPEHPADTHVATIGLVRGMINEALRSAVIQENMTPTTAQSFWMSKHALRIKPGDK